MQIEKTLITHEQFADIVKHKDNLLQILEYEG